MLGCGCRSDLRCLCALRRRTNPQERDAATREGRGFDSCQRFAERQTVCVCVCVGVWVWVRVGAYYGASKMENRRISCLRQMTNERPLR